VTLRLMTYNIRRGGAGRAEAIARVIASCAPDVVLLHEATRLDVVEEIARRTNMADWRVSKNQSLAYLSREQAAFA